LAADIKNLKLDGIMHTHGFLPTVTRSVLKRYKILVEQKNSCEPKIRIENINSSVLEISPANSPFLLKGVSSSFVTYLHRTTPKEFDGFSARGS